MILPDPCKQREILFETRHGNKHRIDEQTLVRDKVVVCCCSPGDLPSSKYVAPQIHMYVYAHGCMLIIINEHYTCIYCMLHTRTQIVSLLQKCLSLGVFRSA